jgi:hypothetical protein
MHHRISLNSLLPETGETPDQQLTLFALLTLGMLESLANWSAQRYGGLAGVLPCGELCVCPQATTRQDCPEIGVRVTLFVMQESKGVRS